MKTHAASILALSTFALTGTLVSGLSAATQHETLDGDQAQAAESRERFGAFNPPPFEIADANGNGVLEAEEVHAFGLPLSWLDRDNNGYVTREEYMTGTARFGADDSQIGIR